MTNKTKTLCARKRTWRGENIRREEHTFHELSLLFGELLMPVGLEEAVVP